MKKLLLSIPMAFSLAFVFTATAHAEKEKGAAEAETTIKGEVVDTVCYVDHGAKGEKHAECAAKCINAGLPVGLKAEDGHLYTIVGDHAPINKELAAEAGKTVSVKGKVVSRDGMNMIENATLVK